MEKLSLADYMATHPEGTLEEIAHTYGTSFKAVAEHVEGRVFAPGDMFDQVWEAITTWGVVTTLMHTDDAILEFNGELPSGTHRHGWFNLRGRHGLSGHIRASHCQTVCFLERKFMGMDTASVVFLNDAGNAMLKVFVGRDDHRQLLASQLAAFRALGQRLQD